jgi:predicted MFS family arabinose efflux permease
MIRFVALLLLLSFAAVGAIFYTPALPGITKELGITQGASQLTVMFFLAGYAFGQLPYGPLSNAIGRKQSVYLGCVLAIVGSILCAVANDFWLLSVGRIIASLGMAVGLVVTFTIVGDLYNRQQSQRIVSYLVLSFAVLPAIGVAIGGLMTEYLGWRSCFYFLIGYSLLIAWFTSRLPSTGPEPDLRHLRLGEALLGMWRQARDPLVLFGGIFIGLGTLMVYVFAAEAPFIAITRLGLSADWFGLLNLVAYVGFAVGSVVSARLPHTLSLAWVLGVGLALVTFFAALSLFFFAIGWVSLWTLFIPTSCLFFALPTTYSRVVSWVLSSATDKSNASSFMSFMNMLTATIGVLLLSYLFPNVVLVMPLMFLGAAILMIATAMRLFRTSAKREHL